MRRQRFGVPSVEVPHQNDDLSVHYICTHGCSQIFPSQTEYQNHHITTFRHGVRYCPEAKRFEHPGCDKRHRKMSAMLRCSSADMIEAVATEKVLRLDMQDVVTTNTTKDLLDEIDLVAIIEYVKVKVQAEPSDALRSMLVEALRSSDEIFEFLNSDFSLTDQLAIESALRAVMDD